jgi:ribosomal subunit interface protein
LLAVAAGRGLELTSDGRLHRRWRRADQLNSSTERTEAGADWPSFSGGIVDIVVRGHHTGVSDEFRSVVEEKLGKAARLDPRMQRVDVELTKESNPRLADRAFRVELTCRCKGPVVRAEAASDEERAALDAAVSKLESRLRRSAERRIDRRRHAAGLPGDAETVTELPAVEPDGVSADAPPLDGSPTNGEVGWAVEIASDGPMIVREKFHQASAMNLDQALYEMELVGHDFFLFVDAGSGCPSVVYRRRGYDYGVIHLEVSAVG